MNYLNPSHLVFKYLGYQVISGDYNAPQSVRDSVKTSLLKPPVHGTIVPLGSGEFHGWGYHGNAGYEGKDQATFLVEVSGKRYKVIINYLVHKVVDDKAVPPECERVFPQSTAPSGGAMHMPDIPQEYPSVVIAQATQAKDRELKVDRTIGVCSLPQNQPDSHLYADNVISPLLTVNIYFDRIEHRAVGLKGKITVLQGPTHGVLEKAGEDSYSYKAPPGYVGKDRATLLVELDGRKVKVVYFFNVLESGPGGTEGYDPYEDKNYCPRGRSIWKISLNPDDSSANVMTLQSHKSWTGDLAQSIKVNLNIADIPRDNRV